MNPPHLEAGIASLATGRGVVMRITVAATTISLSVAAIAATSNVAAAIRKPTNIPPERLQLALQSLARQRDFQLVYRADLVSGLQTEGAHGDLTTGEALSQILHGTGLTYSYLDDKAVTIVPATAGTASNPAASEVPRAAGEPSSDKDEEKAGRSFWDRFRLANVDPGKASSDASVEQPADPAPKQGPVRLEEVLITGSRIAHAPREGAQDIQVYTREQIDRSGQTTLVQFLNTLPAV